MKTTAEISTHYLYIVQVAKETSWCKIGKTNDLERRLKEYNNMTGKSQENIYQYLFTCEVSNMTQVEGDIKKEFPHLVQIKNKEIYLYNPVAFKMYVNFIKSHKLFVKEIFLKTEPKPIITEVIVKKTTPSLEERGIAPITVMNQAKKVKNDEFYTQYEDIEKEISMYDKEIWNNKVVFCNCDDAVDNEKDERRTSAFALYFIKNFTELKLKKLICTHYVGGLDIFNQGSKGYVFTYEFTNEGCKENWDYPKGFTGSFDDPLSLKILNEESDIVCTNPPFSKSIEYWKVLMESGKKFLIISNHRIAIHTKYIPYFKENKVWAGYNEVLWYLNFRKELAKAAGYWFTNFPIKDRPKYNNLKIMPLKKIPEKYKKIDDEKILIVDKNYIPNDYNKPFAVSVYPIVSGILEKGYKIADTKEYIPVVNGKKKFSRVLIQKAKE